MFLFHANHLLEDVSGATFFVMDTDYLKRMTFKNMFKLYTIISQIACNYRPMTYMLVSANTKHSC